MTNSKLNYKLLKFSIINCLKHIINWQIDIKLILKIIHNPKN